MALRTEREKGAHLLRRFGLGASEAELDYYLEGKGLPGAIDKLLNYESVDENFNVPIQSMANQNGQVNMPLVQLWWMTRLITTRRPLQEKMTLFWHDHFATSAAKVAGPPLMFGQNQLLRENATGKFQTLLLEVSKDPAMLFWLDNQYNVKGKPNENFAREVMELFTLGIGNYSEKDIQEAARAFTGWTIGRAGARPRQQNQPVNDQNLRRGAEFAFRPMLHDEGVKEILGNKGTFTGEDVCGILVGNPQTGKYITKKMWEWFAYPNPDNALLEKFTNKFRDSGLDMKVLIRSIMEAPEFYSDKAERAVFKNPVDFVIPTLRQLGVGENMAAQVNAQESVPRARLVPSVAAQQTTKAMGMELLFPPDVDGWQSGPEWISTATMVERIQWADRLFGAATDQGGRGLGGGRQQRAQIRVPAYPLFANDPSPKGVVEKLVSLFDAPSSVAKKPELIQAAEKSMGGPLTPQNANRAASSVTRLIFGSPEFQMA